MKLGFVSAILADNSFEDVFDFATFHTVRKKPLKHVETYAVKILSPEDYTDININTEDYATILLRFDN